MSEFTIGKRPSRGETMGDIRHDVTRFTGDDIHLFKEGTHFRLYEKLGSHVMEVGGLHGVYFAVWAPNAAAVSVVGDWNDWAPRTYPLAVRSDDTGIWEGFIPGIGKGIRYKYHIVSKYGGYEAKKGDPFVLHWEQPPQTASLVWDTSHAWGDGAWLKKRHAINGLGAPISIYEVHPGSWRRIPEEIRKSPCPLRLSLYPSRQKAPLHGRRVWTMARMVSRRKPPLAPPRLFTPFGDTEMASGSERVLSPRAFPPRTGIRCRWF